MIKYQSMVTKPTHGTAELMSFIFVLKPFQSHI